MHSETSPDRELCVARTFGRTHIRFGISSDDLEIAGGRLGVLPFQ